VSGQDNEKNQRFSILIETPDACNQLQCIEDMNRGDFDKFGIADTANMEECKMSTPHAPKVFRRQCFLLFWSTVPDSFHNTNSINGFRGMFGLNKAII
jgi:hypothetical protein